VEILWLTWFIFCFVIKRDELKLSNSWSALSLGFCCEERGSFGSMLLVAAVEKVLFLVLRLSIYITINDYKFNLYNKLMIIEINWRGS